ncbi:unnamed protein product [Caretta caretta]
MAQKIFSGLSSAQRLNQHIRKCDLLQNCVELSMEVSLVEIKKMKEVRLVFYTEELTRFLISFEFWPCSDF